MAVQKTETFIPSVKFNKLTKEQYDQAVLNGEIQPTEFYLVEELNDNFESMIKSVYDPENKNKPYIPADEALDKETYGGSAAGVVKDSDNLGGKVPQWWMPTGSVIPYAGESAPDGWLLCDGAAVSRTTYAALFAVIGTTFGSGDGSTTFNLPDLRGRVAVGVTSDANLGQTEGATSYTADTAGHILTADELAPHSHEENGAVWANATGENYFTPTSSGANWINAETAGKRGPLTTDITGEGEAHVHLFIADVMQPSLYLHQIIKI